jgi:hypothetical protein
MVERHSKSHHIEVFTTGDIVALKLPRGTRTSIDMRRVFGRVLSMPHEHKYEIQTEWGVIDRLFLVKELVRVPAVNANGMEINGPSKGYPLRQSLFTPPLVSGLLSLVGAKESALQTGAVVSKESIAQFTAMMMQSMIVGFWLV